tara:strand:- start:2263 stop:2895 length:633 start_codon:yes stop_codon:yes gene_type:complete
MVNDQICVLCRGESIKLIMDRMPWYQPGDMLIVNEFNEELKNEFIHNLFMLKDITHMVSKDCGLSNLKREYYKKYNINKAILNRFEYESRQCSHMRILLQNFGLDPIYLPEILKPFQKEGGGFPTTGSISILYSTLVLKKKDIHIAGMDFYETDYFNKIPAKDYQKIKGQILKEYMIKFIKTHSDVNYTFYTYSEFNPNLKNVKVIRGSK